MNLYSFSRTSKRGGIGFGPRPTHCSVCRKALTKPEPGAVTTGYGCGKGERILTSDIPPSYGAPKCTPSQWLERSPAVCYACCAERDKAQMIETGRATLYLDYHGPSGMNQRGSKYPYWAVCTGELTNWPGSLRFSARVKAGHHNWARVRFDAWFTGPDGKQWHAVCIGDNSQVARCTRVKG